MAPFGGRPRHGTGHLNHEKELGQIAVGFYADIVAIDGEPLKNIEDVIKGVKRVMKDGRVVVDKR